MKHEWFQHAGVNKLICVQLAPPPPCRDPLQLLDLLRHGDELDGEGGVGLLDVVEHHAVRGFLLLQVGQNLLVLARLRL